MRNITVKTIITHTSWTTCETFLGRGTSTLMWPSEGRLREDCEPAEGRLRGCSETAWGRLSSTINGPVIEHLDACV